MEPTADVRTFFTEYERIANDSDLEALEACFGDQCLAASPGFAACTTDRAQLHAVLEGAAEQYCDKGRVVHLVSLEEQPLGMVHTLVTVGWTAAFPPASEPIPFEISYLLQRQADALRIIAFVSHEDEAALMRAHGLEG